MIYIQSRNDTNLDEWSEPKGWTIEEVLEEINRDHSDDWMDYNIFDWLEGWMEWVEGEYHKIYYTRANYVDITVNGYDEWRRFDEWRRLHDQMR